MGTLRSSTDHRGLTVGKVTLGEPAEMDDGTFVWSDGRIPDGVIDPDGTITIDGEDI